MTTTIAPHISASLHGYGAHRITVLTPYCTLVFILTWFPLPSVEIIRAYMNVFYDINSFVSGGQYHWWFIGKLVPFILDRVRLSDTPQTSYKLSNDEVDFIEGFEVCKG